MGSLEIERTRAGEEENSRRGKTTADKVDGNNEREFRGRGRRVGGVEAMEKDGERKELRGFSRDSKYE